MALPSNPNASGGGTLSRILETITGTAKGIGQQVTGSAAREEALEAQRARQKQVSLLEKIEENTRSQNEGDGGDKEEDSKGGGILAAIMGLFGAIKAFSITGFIKGLFSSIFRFMGRALWTGLKSIGSFIGKGIMGIGRLLFRGILAIGRTLFSLKFLKRLLFRIFPLAMLFGAIGSGILDAFNSFMNGDSIGTIIANFLGGMIEFITFGFIDSETIVNAVTGLFDWIGEIWETMKTAFTNGLNAVLGFVDTYITTPVTEAFGYIGELFNTYIATPLGEIWTTVSDTLSAAWETVSTFINDNLITPISNLFGTISDAFTTYVGDPIWNAIETVSNLINDYLITPITNAFSGLSDWFSSLFDPVMEFLSDFGLPEMTIFTNPITGTEYKIGPWYPFRSDEVPQTEIPGEGASGTTESANDLSPAAEMPMVVDPSIAIAMRRQTEQQQREAEISEIEREIAVEQARINRSNAGENEYFGREHVGREESAERIAELQERLAALNPAPVQPIGGVGTTVTGAGDGVDRATAELNNSTLNNTNVTVVAPTTSSTNVNNSNNVAVSPSVRSQDSTMSQYQMNAAVG